MDALHSVDSGGGRIERWRMDDVPFDPQAGEVLFTRAAAALRKMPAHTWRVQLLAVEAAGKGSFDLEAFRNAPHDRALRD